MDCVIDARRSPTVPDAADAVVGVRRSHARIGAPASTLSRRDGVRRFDPARSQWRFGGLIIAAAVNVAAVAALFWSPPSPMPARAPDPLRVSVLTLPTVPPPPPRLPPKPRLQHYAPPQVSLPPSLEPLPETVPEPLVAVAPSPQAIIVTQAPPAPVAAAPAPVTPPSFDADYLKNPTPAYPPVSRRLGERGKVVLRVLVSAGGLPDKVELRTSSGFDRLDQAALDVVTHWRFVPARLGDIAVQGWVLIPINFVLRT